MTDPHTRDYLHEELQRRSIDMELKKEREIWKARQGRKQRMKITGLISIFGVVFATYFFRDFDTFIATVMALATSFVGLAFYYLQPSSIGKFDPPGDLENYRRTKFYIDERIAETIEELKGAASKTIEFTEQDKAQVFASIQAKLESEALEKYLTGMRELMLWKVREETLDDRFQHTRHRLGQEVQDLAKRGNLNLILGILTTISGLSVLGYAVFNPPATIAAPELLSYFVPRVSLVLLIEVFAYFFLRLYKQSLNEIKYFQNEITNVEAKHLALQVTLQTDDSVLRTKVVEALAGTERNFILTKDQTTVDLERERLTKDTYANITDAIKDLLKKKLDG